MLLVFAGIVLALAGRTLWDECRETFFRGRGDVCVGGELLEFPLPDGWLARDVLTTLAEIEAL